MWREEREEASREEVEREERSSASHASNLRDTMLVKKGSIQPGFS